MRSRPLIRCLAAMLCAGVWPPAAADVGDRYLSVNASRLTKADFEGLAGGGDVRTQDNQVAAAFARFARGDATIDFGLDYQYTRYKYNDVDSRNRDLHRVQMPVWFSMPYAGWQIRAHIAPGIFTSSNVLGDFFNRGSSDDLYVSGRLELKRQDAARAWLVGLAHDRSFGQSLSYPVAGLSLAPSDSVRLRLAWPDPAVDVTLSDRQALSFRVFPAGSQWHVRTDDFAQEFDYRFEAWRSQLTWNLGVFESVSVDVSLGYEFERAHFFTDDPGNRINATAKEQWLFAVGFRLGAGPLPLTHGYHLNR